MEIYLSRKNEENILFYQMLSLWFRRWFHRKTEAAYQTVTDHKKIKRKSVTAVNIEKRCGKNRADGIGGQAEWAGETHDAAY